MSDDRLQRIEEKIDQLLDHHSEMRAIQSEQAADIRHHIKRTDLLEAQVRGLHKYVYTGLGVAVAIGALLKTVL